MRGDELDYHMKHNIDIFPVEGSAYWKWLDGFFYVENLYVSIS